MDCSLIHFDVGKNISPKMGLEFSCKEKEKEEKWPPFLDQLVEINRILGKFKTSFWEEAYTKKLIDQSGITKIRNGDITFLP